MSMRLRIASIVSSGIRPTLASRIALGVSGRATRSRLARHLPQLLQRPLARRRRLLLLADARLVVGLAAAQLGQDPGLLDLLLEAAHRLLEGLVLLHLHQRQVD